MHLKIYFDNKPLFLCNAIDPEIVRWREDSHTLFLEELSTETIRQMITAMQDPAIHAGIILHSSLDELKETVWKQFTIMQAGGGLVENLQGEVLMIFRRGKWDLPKGKLDEGETIEQCALREVAEETGLHRISLEQHLLTTYHTYHQQGEFILKESHWYKMRLQAEQTLVPQTEEDIAEARWVSRDALPALMDNSFPSVRDVLEQW